MEIKYHSDDKLVIKDDTKELSFIDLAQVYGYELKRKPKHHWVLYQWNELVKNNKIQYELLSTNYSNGKTAEIIFGYYLNDINRRTIELNEDGTVRKDYIIIFNPRNIHRPNYFYATVPQGIQLKNYLSEDKKYFESYDKSERFKNTVLDDQLVQDYLYYRELYCSLLNHYCDDYEMLNNIIQRFDDEWYLDYLKRSIKNKNGPVKKLDRKKTSK